MSKKEFMSRRDIMVECGYSDLDYNESFGEEMVGAFVYEAWDELCLWLRNDGKFVFRAYGMEWEWDCVIDFEIWFENKRK
jgi:hypothetical protein